MSAEYKSGCCELKISVEDQSGVLEMLCEQFKGFKLLTVARLTTKPEFDFREAAESKSAAIETGNRETSPAKKIEVALSVC